MNIILATCGSRGDVQPLIALGIALREAGHYPVLCCPPENAEWVRDYGLNCRPVGRNLMEFLEKNHNIRSVLSLLIYTRKLKEEIAIQLNELPDIFAGADLVIGSSLMMGARTAADYLHLPYLFMAYCPQIFPSAFHPMMYVPNVRLSPSLNRLSWMLFKYLNLDPHYRSVINSVRQKLGLPLVTDMAAHILGDHVILATDRLLGTVPRDVNIPFTQTGYLHLKQCGSISEELETFIKSGTPPVFLGFGSMPLAEPLALTGLITDTARLAGIRLVMYGKNLPHNSNSQYVFTAGNTPHDQLFPRMAVVIHHGGAGTTATAARAGIPQIIIPHILDQFFWADQVYRQGIGPLPLNISRLSAETLTNAIQQCLHNPQYARTTAQYARIIQRQQSLTKAVDTIEAYYMNCRK